ASGSAGSRRPGSAWGSSGPPGAGRPFCLSERKRETAEDTPDARLRGADVYSGPEVEGRFDRPSDLFQQRVARIQLVQQVSQPFDLAHGVTPPFSAATVAMAAAAGKV